MYECRRCGYQPTYKYMLINHLNTNIPCKIIKENIDRNELLNELNKTNKSIIENGIKFYKCLTCDKLFKSTNAKNTHQRKCNYKNILIENIKNAIEESTNINNTNIINNINNINNVTNINNGNITNNMVINYNFNNINEINDYLKDNAIKLLPFPSYTIGHLLDNNGEIFTETIKKCKKEDKDPVSAYKSSFRLILELFKEILSYDNPRTKNIFMFKKTDNVAYVLLDNLFYSIHIEDLFILIFEHLPGVINKIKKLKDRYNGLDKDDKDYTEFAIQEFFNNFLNKSDKSDFKIEIIDAFYQNKKFLEDFLSNAKRSEKVDEFNHVRTYTVGSKKIDSLRRNRGLIKQEPDINNEFEYLKDDHLQQLNKSFRSKRNVVISENVNINNKDTIPTSNDYISEFDMDETSNDYCPEFKIVIDYDTADTKTFPDEKVAFKTEYKGIYFWYNEQYNIGCICNSKSQKLITKDKLFKKICDLLE